MDYFWDTAVPSWAFGGHVFEQKSPGFDSKEHEKVKVFTYYIIYIIFL